MRTILGVILAGGLSQRMGGGDKALRALGRGSMLARVLARLAPQVDMMVLNANGDPGRFAQFGLPVVQDGVPDHPGPLAGILAGMDWAAIHRPDLSYVASVAADTPFFPEDLVAGLSGVMEPELELAVARSPSGIQPVFGLWRVDLRDDLRLFLAVSQRHRVQDWIARHRHQLVDFPAMDGRDPFFNVNTPEDLAAAALLVAGEGLS